MHIYNMEFFGNNQCNKEVTMTLHAMLEHLGAEPDESKLMSLLKKLLDRSILLSAEIEKENETTKKLLRKKKDIEALIQASNEVKKTREQHATLLSQQMWMLKNAITKIVYK